MKSFLNKFHHLLYRADGSRKKTGLFVTIGIPGVIGSSGLILRSVGIWAVGIGLLVLVIAFVHRANKAKEGGMSK